MVAKISLVGDKVGYLEVLEELPRQKNQRQVRYLCRCRCGKTVETTAACLRGGKNSCGCRFWKSHMNNTVCSYGLEKK